MATLRSLCASMAIVIIMPSIETVGKLASYLTHPSNMLYSLPVATFLALILSLCFSVRKNSANKALCFYIKTSSLGLSVCRFLCHVSNGVP